MRIPSLLMPHTVDLHPLGGQTATGRKNAATKSDVRALVEDGEVLADTATTTELLSSAKITLDPENAVPLGSTITLWKGMANERTAKVVSFVGRGNTLLEFVSYRLE